MDDLSAQRLVIDGRGIGASHAGVRVYLTNILRACSRASSPLTMQIICLLEKDFWDNLDRQLKLDIDGATAIEVQINKPIGKLKIINGLLKVFLPVAGLGKNDLYLSVDYYGVIFGRARKYYIVHDVHFRQYPATFGFRQRGFRSVIFAMHGMLNTRLLTISQQSQQQIARYFPKLGNCQIIGSGSGLSLVEPVAPQFSYPEAFYISVGTLHAHKNQVALIEAFSAVARVEVLILVGKDGNASEQVNRAIETANATRTTIIHLTDISDANLAWLYQRARGAIFASRFEGYGLPVAEAIDMACPVACSNLDVLQAIAGEAATYFDPGSRDDMQRCLTEFIACSDSRLRLVQNGRDRAHLVRFDTVLDTLSRLFSAQ